MLVVHSYCTVVSSRLKDDSAMHISKHVSQLSCERSIFGLFNSHSHDRKRRGEDVQVVERVVLLTVDLEPERKQGSPQWSSGVRRGHGACQALRVRKAIHHWST